MFTFTILGSTTASTTKSLATVSKLSTGINMGHITKKRVSTSGASTKCEVSPKPTPSSSPITDHKKCPSSRKRVSFDDQTVVMYVPTRDEYSPEEQSMYWYNNSEYTQFRLNSKAIAKAIANSGLTLEDVEKDKSNDTLCVRGIEFKCFFDSAVQRRICRDEAMEAVMEEQCRLELDGRSACQCPENIRQVYQKAVLRVQLRAMQQGCKDAADAKEFLNESSEPVVANPNPEEKENPSGEETPSPADNECTPTCTNIEEKNKAVNESIPSSLSKTPTSNVEKCEGLSSADVSNSRARCDGLHTLLRPNRLRAPFLP